MKKGRTSVQRPEVALLMGSDSDWQTIEKAVSTVREFGIECEARVISAHRTPREAARYAESAAERGIKVIMAAAGGAAHLAGVLAAHCTLPVIGIPIKSGALDGMDSLLSTVQMPAGVPVATVTLGSAGAVNAAILAIQILAVDRPALAAKLARHKRTLKSKVAESDAHVRRAAAKMRRQHDR